MIVCMIEIYEKFDFIFYIELKEAFDLFDRVGGGVIRTKDLAYVMHSIGYQTTPTQLEQMIREVDLDGLLEYNF